MGNLVAETDANGRTTRYIYDELNRLVQTISAEGVETAQAYNAAGQVVTTTDGLGRATVNAYDALGRLAAVTDAEGNVTRYEYDGLGNQVVITDANGARTAYEYDSLNRLMAVVENQRIGEPENEETNVRTQYVYDILGNRLVITNALGYTSTRTTYDVLGRPVVVEDALGHQTRTQYNALGYRTVVTDANGTVTHYTYDGLNQLVEVAYGGEDSVQYVYDALGRRTAMTDAVGETSYLYDELGRLVQVDDPLAGTMQYVYDLAGNRTRLIYPDGQIVTYTYDADNRLAQAEDWDGGITTYDYDDAGQLITTTLPNGVVSVNAYDNAGRLAGLTHTASSGILSGYSYELDGVGNRVSAVETLTDTTRTIAYAYDALNRLIEAEYDDGKLFQYVYDAVGNRTRYTETLTQTAVITYAYDPANRLTQVGNVAYTYDNNGSLTNDGVFTYIWDAAGRLVQAQSVTHTVVYTYNGDGVRVAQSVNNSTTIYVQDILGLPQVLVETTQQPNGQITYLYSWGRLAQVNEGSWGWFLPDALGSVRQLVNDTGEVVLSRDYDPYGQVMSSSGTSGSGYGYAGEQQDAYTGLVFLRARYLALTVGRFLSMDPWEGSRRQPGTLQKYAYVLDNPINSVDPTGLFDPQQIEDSLGFSNGLFDVYDRWGLYALLLDAEFGDKLLPRYLDFKYNGDYWPLAPAPRGGWKILEGECGKLKFSNSEGKIVSLVGLIQALEDQAQAILPTIWWRPRTTGLHWYELRRNPHPGLWITGKFYSDFGNTTDVPDVLVGSGSLELDVPEELAPLDNFSGGIGVSIMCDRYGNLYRSFSVGIGLGAGLPNSYWEGYASRPGITRLPKQVNKEQLRNIIEGPGVSYTIQMIMGFSVDFWRSGYLHLYGQNSATSIEYAWGITKAINKTTDSWDWVDDVPGYDASIRDTASP